MHSPWQTRRAILALIPLVLTCAAVSSARAETLRYAGDLIRREVSPLGLGASSNRSSGVEIVEVDASVLADDPDLLWLELVEGEGRWAYRTAVERGTGSDLVWRGGFEDDPPGHSSVTISLRDELVFGTFHPRGGPVHLLRPRRGGGSELVRLDPSELECHAGAHPLEDFRRSHPDEPGPVAGVGSMAPYAVAADERTIYVMVLYTPNAAANYGHRELEVASHHNVDFMNTAFANSGIDGQVRLATALEADLGFLRGRGLTGALDRARTHPLVRELRDHWRADLFVVVPSNEDFSVGCGYANVMTRGLVGPQMEDQAFSIVEDGCFNGFTFTHELGHNLGAQHNHENAHPIEQAAYPFSFAHGAEGYFRTLMSYPSACSDCYLVLDLFSNPLVIRDGVPAGIPDERDNARTLNLTIPVAAAFRSGLPPGPPPPPPVPPKPSAPVDVRASPVSPTEILLEWSHDRYDVTGFQIETRRDGSWTRIAAPPLADEMIHRVTSLVPDTEYHFRIRAMNGSSASGYSDVATARTPRAVPVAPSGLSAEPLSDSEILLRWAPSTDASTWEIDVRAGDPGLDRGPETIPAAPEGTVVSGLDGDTPFTFRIRARNDHGVSDWSPPASATTLGPAGRCAPDPTTLCLESGRFRIRTRWRIAGSSPRHGVAETRPAPGSDRTGLFTFFRPDNVELVVKVLDGRAVDGSFWVYYGALSDVEYWITVQDTVRGGSRTYRNEPAELCGRGDRKAFPEPSPEPASGSPTGFFPTGPYSLLAPAPAAATCSESPDALCLAGGRFRVDVEWENHHQGGARGTGRVFAGLETDRSGHFWFFRPDNLELSVKILDGRTINGHFWIFWGGLSDLAYRIRVTDTESNETFDFQNPAGTLCGGRSLDTL